VTSIQDRRPTSRPEKRSSDALDLYRLLLQLDAIEAARAALSGRAFGVAKTRDGNVEAIRTLMVARRSARESRTKAVNQIRQLVYTAPDELRERFVGLP
jgi:hypothetical protein